MRKIFLFMMVSIDGFFEGVGHDLSWHNVDEEFNQFAIKQLNEVDTLFFGRRTYQLMASYWPTEAAKADDQDVAKLMIDTPKVVFSKTLAQAEWEHTQLIKQNTAEEVKKLKQQAGKSIAILGSNNLCVSLMQDNLVDEFRIMINPVVIGRGTILFTGIKEKFNLDLTDTRVFKSGNVLLYYRPKIKP